VSGLIQPAELSRSLSATILISTAGASFSRVSLSMKIDLNDSPAEQVRTGYHAGASGILVRSQLQKLF